MPGRLAVLSFLQGAAMTLRHLARDEPSSISGELVRIADEIARQAGKLEAELLAAGIDIEATKDA